MPTALITGITGQDGGYLAETLLADGWQVHGLVRPADPALDETLARSPQIVAHEGDLSDADRVTALVDDLEPDEIYNLGGISSVALSWAEPVATALINGVGAGIILQAAWLAQERLGRPVRVLQASSAEIFGAPESSPQDETTPIRPVSPYGAAKAFAHHLVGVYRGRGLLASSCILYNHESPRRPDTFVTRKITKAAADIAAGKQDELVLGSLDVRRDWGWAPDYVDAMMRAIRHPIADEYVIATGESRSIRDFVAAAFEYVGRPDWERYVRTDPALVRPADPEEQLGNSAHARTTLGWAPTVSFQEMVARMVDEDLVTDLRDPGRSR
jgi:GDPmannose 4,6-dehydratase